MVIERLDLGFAAVSVTVNGNPIKFKAEKDRHDTFWLKDDTEVHPAGSLNLEIDLLPLRIGDEIMIEFDRGTLVCDGGSYCTLNLVGEIGEFTVGIGVPDTQDYEREYSGINDGGTEGVNQTKRVLPYEMQEFTDRGFQFLIVDDPQKYNDRKYRKSISVGIVWEYTSQSYAWDIVSYLTC